jgi:ABC-type antimicrobial peptide transport system permease subunit
MDPILGNEPKEKFAAENLFDWAETAVGVIPPGKRMDYYINSNYDEIQSSVTSFVADLTFRLGFSRLTTDVPIVDQLSILRIFSIFLGLIINVIIFILLFISTVLVFSLLSANIETRTFELAVMRMLGVKQLEMISLLLVQASSYSIFSYPVGIGVAQLFCVWLFSEISDLIGTSLPAWISWQAVLLAAALGFLMPVISAIFPIRSALGRDLFSSLDARHSKTTAVKIHIERTQDLTISWSLISVGIGLLSFGVGVGDF